MIVENRIDVKNETNVSVTRRWVPFTPFLLIGVCFAVNYLAGTFIGVWAWVPTALVFWGMMCLFIQQGAGLASWRKWLKKPRGGKRWLILSIVIGLFPLSILLMNSHVLSAASIFIFWLLFALINPWLEEGYWRGLLLDATQRWPSWLSVIYISGMYALSHPFIWGVHSLANRHYHVIVFTLVAGVVWAMICRRTKSLRWCIMSHFLVDIGNLAVPVFLNLYIPTGM